MYCVTILLFECQMLPVKSEISKVREFHVHMSVHRKSKSIIQRDATLYSLLLLQTALHVLGSDATNHQEHIQLHSQQLVLVVVSELLPPAIVVR
jgi:hypothetical protein